MGDIVTFGAKKKSEEAANVDKPELVWTCAHCGCMTFVLYNTEVTECAGCLHRDVDGMPYNWRQKLPETPEEPKLISSDNTTVKVQDTDLVFRGLKKQLDTSDDLASVLIIRKDGGMRMWCSGLEDDRQEEWYREHLGSYENFLFNQIRGRSNTEEG